MTVRLGVIGDVHLAFNDRDVAYFNASDLDALLIVGDLAKTTGRGGRRIGRVLSRLTKPTLIIPGNHDNVLAVQLLSETLGFDRLSAMLGSGQAARMSSWHEACGGAQLCGYSHHPMTLNGQSFDIIAARPHSMGGNRLHFQRYLTEAFGVRSLEDSVALLKRRIDECQSNRLVFLAHNGPTGLGANRDDIWGCDFRAEAGDFGDPDLAQAIAYAKECGKRVLLVAAGHMHHRLRGGGIRKWLVRREETTYLNAARVPRIEDDSGVKVHHHVRVEIKDDTVSASAIEIR